MAELDLLIGTKNVFKIQEQRWFVADLPFLKIHHLDELGEVPEIEEDGETLKENAEKKALELSKLTPWIVFASDFGAGIPGLGDKWDYRRPKRIMGEHATEEERARKLIEMMVHLKGEDRAANYPLALALAEKGKLLWSKEFTSYTGMITDNPDFDNIGPNKAIGRLWIIPEFNQTEDRLTPTQHNILRERYQSGVKKEIEELLASMC